MITGEQLESEGFIHYDHREWIKDQIGIFLEDGMVSFIRERENYSGLNVRIHNLKELRLFLSFIPE